MSQPPCECPGPGFCPRYRIHQGTYAHSICKGVGCTPEKSERYRRKWRERAEKMAEGDQSRQVKPPRPASPLPVVPRPRTHQPRPSPASPSAPAQGVATPAGPGTELKVLLASLGLHPNGCKCTERMQQMDKWGIEGCKVHRNEILGWLREEADKRHWWDRFRAGMNAVRQGIVSTELLSNPLSALLDTALNRASQNSSITSPSPTNTHNVPDTESTSGGKTNDNHGHANIHE